MKRKIHWVFLFFCCVLPACDDDNCDPAPPLPPPPMPVVISGIEGIPEGVTFDRVKAEISGFEWEVITTVEAGYADGQATLILPSPFMEEELAKVTSDYKGDRHANPPVRPDYTGFWPGTASDDEAKVAGLGDIFAYNGEQRVGRVYLTDWPGSGTQVGYSWTYFHYTDRDYDLSGSYVSYLYSASFKKGWNVYVRKNLKNYREGSILCTTEADSSAVFVWRFESHVF